MLAQSSAPGRFGGVVIGTGVFTSFVERLQLRAQHIEELVDAVKAAGLPVLSEGAVAVPISPEFQRRAGRRSKHVLLDAV